MPSIKKIPFVMTKDYVQVTLEGSKPFALNASHPTFARLCKAIKEKDWKKVPKLVSIAESIKDETQGNVELKKGKVFFKGEEARGTLADRIMQLINRDKPVKHLMRFMNNLYRNPSREAREEFFGWLENNELPVTDNGCFLAYKSLDRNLKDEHTHTIDNSPGQIIMGARNLFDNNYRQQCSSGFHICSKQYGLYGSRVVAVLVNPAHVLSAQSGKLRVTQYEVLKELGSISDSDFRRDGFAELEKQLVVEIKKERKELIQMLLKSPAVVRGLKKRKTTKKKYTQTLLKTSYARLKALVIKYDLIPKVGPENQAYLEGARKASGISAGQLAKKMAISLKKVYEIERELEPEQTLVDSYLRAIADLVGIRDLHRSAITFPKALAKV